MILMELAATRARIMIYTEGGGDQRNLHASGLAHHLEPLLMAINDTIATTKAAFEIAEVFNRQPGAAASDFFANKQAH